LRSAPRCQLFGDGTLRAAIWTNGVVSKADAQGKIGTFEKDEETTAILITVT
jgi:hypothetical protein